MKILFVSIKHRESKLFDEGIELIKADFPVFILDNQNDNYDNGVIKLANIIKTQEWDIVHFVDNDCFITDTKYIKQTLKDFEESDFGFAAYFENGFDNDYTKYDFKGKTIAEVTDQKFIEHYPFMSPSWENAMMMFKREAFDKVTDWSDMNKYIPELHQKGVKFGVKKVEARLKYTHAGEGFIHIGNLMKYYYMFESGNILARPEFEIDAARVGYFLYQRLKFGEDIYTSQMNYYLNQFGENELRAFKTLVKGYYE